MLMLNLKVDSVQSFQTIDNVQLKDHYKKIGSFRYGNKIMPCWDECKSDVKCVAALFETKCFDRKYCTCFLFDSKYTVAKNEIIIKNKPEYTAIFKTFNSETNDQIPRDCVVGSW